MAIPDDRVELIARKSQKLNNSAIDQFITWIPMACRRKEDIHSRYVAFSLGHRFAAKGPSATFRRKRIGFDEGKAGLSGKGS